jgi:hypothetical protein
MSNPIKYSTGSETFALKKGNFYIGTGDVGKGPTSSTGYYNGITPPSGGYTIYLNKETGGPSIYTASNDAQLISLTNSIAGESYTTANECLVYFAGQTDKMVLNRNYEGIVTDGLVLNLDAGFTPSYPRSGTTWTDLSLSGNSGILTNGPTFSSNDGGGIVFDGVDDYVDCNTTSISTNNLTITIWCKPNSTQTRYADIMDFDHTGGGWVIQQNDNATNVYYFAYYNTTLGSYHITSNISLTQNVWQNITVVKNNGTVTIYINNALSTTNTFANSGLGNNKTLWIGNWVSERSRNWNGSLSTSQIYNRALSVEEVLQNYNATKGRFGL